METPGPTNEGHSYLQYARTVGVVTLVIGVFFKLQHWPGANVFIFLAWGIVVGVLLARLVTGRIMEPKGMARDLFALGGISLVGLRLLQFPGTSAALVVMVIGGLGILWYEREKFLPGKSDANTRPWLFYLALVLVVMGTVFRIEHWPYSTPILIGGLALAGIWLFSTNQADHNGK